MERDHTLESRAELVAGGGEFVVQGRRILVPTFCDVADGQSLLDSKTE